MMMIINRTKNQTRRHLASAGLLLAQLLIILPSFMLYQQAKCSQIVESGSRLQSTRAIELHQSNHSDSKPQAQIHHDHQRLQSGQNLTTGVTDLKLKADYRAAKLRWTYRLDGREEASLNQVEPAAFDVRFCELTTWNTEIKCRHREMSVGPPMITDDNHVIRKPDSSVADHQQVTVTARYNNSIEYEAQIFDLRALTNYTFKVNLLRLSDKPESRLNLTSGQLDESQHQHQHNRASKVARRLLLENWPTSNELAARIETKPFRAEATKCLADTSEVVITTGKYFGGRITVENSQDRGCYLIGNKSSEQSSYTFKIDHELCHSKVVNGNRIETMVLVHENKDILTHNTARFLVLCNFLQKSFTLRASISLPKVNGFAANRPAIITPLKGKPNKELPVVLGNSMPGIFRAKTTDQPSEVSSSSDVEAPNGSPSNELDIPSGLEKNAIRKMTEPGDLRQRQPKGLADQRQRSSVSPPPQSSAELLEAESSSSSLTLPKPVRIHSKLLYVDKQPIARLVMAKMSQDNTGTYVAGDSGAQSVAELAKSDELEARKSQMAATEEEGASITLTNNHRVSDDFRSTSSLKFAPSDSLASSSDGGLSIKYSGANISDYSIGQLEEGATTINVADKMAGDGHENGAILPARRGERTGRMQSIGASSGEREPRARPTDRRMGDMATSGGADSIAGEPITDSTDVSSTPTWLSDQSGASNGSGFAGRPNLAQNLTNYLLKWSLKTLTDLAKKSLSSLANRSHLDEEQEAGAERELSGEHQVQPKPIIVGGERTVVQASTSPAPSAGSSKFESDGFDTHSRPPQQQRVRQQSGTWRPAPTSSSSGGANGAQPTIRQVNHEQQQPTGIQPKSLDLDRVVARQSAQQQPGKAGNAIEQPRDSLARANESGHQHMQRPDRPTHPLSSISWLLLAALLALTLLIGLFTIFCLASSQPRRATLSQSGRVEPPPRGSPKTVASLPQLIFSGSIAAKQHHHQQHPRHSEETLTSHLSIRAPNCYSDNRYDYNRFENNPRDLSSSGSVSGSSVHGSDTLASRNGSTRAGSSTSDADSNNVFVPGNRQTKQSAHLKLQADGSAVISRSTGNNSEQRAGGLSSSSLADYGENNCTNSELLLTEHVILDSNSRAAAESYA